jgi:hypothetical protein
MAVSEARHQTMASDLAEGKALEEELFSMVDEIAHSAESPGPGVGILPPSDATPIEQKLTGVTLEKMTNERTLSGEFVRVTPGREGGSGSAPVDDIVESVINPDGGGYSDLLGRLFLRNRHEGVMPDMVTLNSLVMKEGDTFEIAGETATVIRADPDTITIQTVDPIREFPGADIGGVTREYTIPRNEMIPASANTFERPPEALFGLASPLNEVGVALTPGDRIVQIRAQMAQVQARMEANLEIATNEFIALNEASYAGDALSAEVYLHLQQRVLSQQDMLARMQNRLDDQIVRVDKLKAEGEVGQKVELAIARSTPELRKTTQDALSVALDTAHKDVNNVHSAFKTLIDSTLTTGSTIASGATKAERDLLRTIQMISGTSDDMTGAAMLAPVSAIARLIAADPEAATARVAMIERGIRDVFGESPGLLKNQLAAVRRETSVGWREAMQQVLKQFSARTNAAMTAEGIEFTQENMALINEIKTLMAYEKLSKKHPTKFWTTLQRVDPEEAETPTAFLKDLQKIRRSGMLSEHPGLEKRLESIVEDQIGSYLEMGKLEVDLGLLTEINAAYLPLLMSREGELRAKGQLASIPSARRSGRGGGLGRRQQFQMGPRSTPLTRYVEQPTRRTHRLLAMEQELPKQITKFQSQLNRTLVGSKNNERIAKQLDNATKRLADVKDKLAEIEESGGILEPTMRSFHEYDRELLAMNDNQLLRRYGQDPEVLARVTETKNAIIKYDSIVKQLIQVGKKPTADPVSRQKVLSEFAEMVDLEARAELPFDPNDVQAVHILDALAPRQTDPVSLNAAVGNGVLSFLTGGNRGEVFDLNADVLLARRAGMHRYASSQAAFNDAMANKFLTFDMTGTAEKLDGETVLLPGGIEAKVVSTGPGGQKELLIAGERYRKLNLPNIDEQSNPIIQALNIGEEPRERLFNSDVASAIESTARLLDDADEAGKVFRIAERATAMWKSITLAHPSWLITNILGDGLLSFQAGLNPVYAGLLPSTKGFERNAVIDGKPATVARAWFTTVANASRPEVQRGIEFTLGGRKMDGRELFELLEEMGTIGSGRWVDTILMFARNGRLTFKRPEADALRPLQRVTRPVQNVRQVGRNLRDSLRNASDQAATAEKITRIPIPDKAAAGAIALTDRVKSYWSAWYRINGQVSDGQRGLAFLSNIDAGDDFATAAEKVTRNMYDYTDLTRAERRLRLLIPFYTFVKNSFVHQAKLMLQRPAYANSFTKLRQNIEEMLVGEERIPDHLRPAWMREQMAIQVAKDPSKSWAVLPLTLLPADAIIQTAQSIMGVEAAQEFMHYFTSNVNPILKAPVEFGVGREFFSGREIGPDPLRGDIGAAEFALQQIRPFREFGVGGIRQGPVPRAFDKSVAQGLARLTVGGRVQAFDQERREFCNVSLMMRSAGCARRSAWPVVRAPIR